MISIIRGAVTPIRSTQISPTIAQADVGSRRRSTLAYNEELIFHIKEQRTKQKKNTSFETRRLTAFISVYYPLASLVLDHDSHDYISKLMLPPNPPESRNDRRIENHSLLALQRLFGEQMTSCQMTAVTVVLGPVLFTSRCGLVARL
jgi:hypothetical protein